MNYSITVNGRLLQTLCVLIALLLSVPSVYALIIHPEGEPDASWTDHPNPEVIGAYHSYATCVAIAPNYIVTTRHAGVPSNLYIQFEDIRYEVEEIYEQSGEDAVDMRVMKLKNADLDSYVLPHDGSFSEIGRDIFIGGRGARRNSTLIEDEIPYAYTWTSVNSAYLKYGTNRIDSDPAWMASTCSGACRSDIIQADFDAVFELNEYSTDHESTMGGGDSGSGWMVKDSQGQWFLAGLGLAVEQMDVAQFRRVYGPDAYVPDPDLFWGVKVSSYYDWIESNVDRSCPDHRKTDMDDNCVVNAQDLGRFLEYWMSPNACSASNNYCNGADTNMDGTVNYLDASGLYGEMNFAQVAAGGSALPTEASPLKLQRAYQVAQNWIHLGAVEASAHPRLTMTATPPAGTAGTN